MNARTAMPTTSLVDSAVMPQAFSTPITTPTDRTTTTTLMTARFGVSQAVGAHRSWGQSTVAEVSSGMAAIPSGAGDRVNKVFP
jgi:hypothetical protein